MNSFSFRNRFLLFLLFTGLAFAQETTSPVKISGSIFNDFFYNINSVDSTQKDMNGFTVRRIFFTTDYTLSNDFDARLRFEGNQSQGSLTAGGRLTMMVKDAYIKWKNIFKGSELIMGLSPTPSLDLFQAWGYRSLEKSTVDLYNVVPFRDIGIDLKGKLTEDGRYNYWIKIGNNSNNAPETNKYKRYYASVQMIPVSGLELGFYGDYASKPDRIDLSDKQSKSNNQFIWALFVTHINKDVNAFGANMFVINTQNNFSSSSLSPLQNQSGVCYSVWGWTAINEKFRLVGRLDRFTINTALNESTLTFAVAGLDYRPSQNVSIIPNVEWFDYQKNYMGKEGTDLIARITFAYQF